MRARSILITGILLGACTALVFAKEQQNGMGTTGSSETSVSKTTSKKEEALQSKQRGDAYASQEDYKRAADEYAKALSLDSTAFTAEERLRIAIVMFWADRLDEASRILRAILAEDPQNVEARTQLAKVLSLSDKLTEAGAEADTLLENNPDNRDALLVKANVFRWQGDPRASIPLYEKALAQGEDFDARLGLSYAYLDSGNKGTAQEIAKTLKPLYPNQEKELSKFSNTLCGTQTTYVGVQYNYYKDSDNNRVNRSALTTGFRVGTWETELSYRLTDANDPLQFDKGEEVWITSHTKAGKLGAGAGVGVSRADNGPGTLFVGQANADINMGQWAFGMNASREVLSDTAQLIQNSIVRTNETINLSETASPRLTFSESYTHSIYSDDNDANDLRLGTRYAVTLTPFKITTGYRFRYWDFRRQSGSGYFDPENFVSHQVFVSLYGERDGLYAYLEPYTGYQSFTRYGEKSANFFSGYSASAGWNMKKCTAFELNSEGGNYAGGSTAGFNYYMVGFRLVVNF